LTSENGVFGGPLTLPKNEIVDCGAFFEVIFFCISPKNLLGDFFYNLNGLLRGGVFFTPSLAAGRLDTFCAVFHSSISILSTIQRFLFVHF
jgi:hypothetical protein